MAIRREAVLQVFRRRARPTLTPRDVARELGVPRHQLKTVRRLLRSLAEEGELERLEGRYRAPRPDGLVEGMLEEGRGRGLALVAADGSRAGVADAGEARAGDRVLALPRPDGRADVIQVLEGERREWVGILERTPIGGFLTPYRGDVAWGFRIAASDLGDARDGDVVVAVPGRRRAKGGEPRLRVAQVLGPPGSPEADFRAVVWHRRLPVEFPEAVLAEAEAPRAELEPAEIARRVDLRDRDFLTIDPATARDHDDAVSVEATRDGGWRLWVAIADVSHYVPEGSALDREALRRGNSVYFPDRAIPMLPERLSGDLCSLRPDVDRYAVCVELELAPDAEVRRRSWYPAVIRSRARLAYEEAAAVMAGETPPRTLPEPVCEQLRLLGAAAARLTRRRLAAGSLDFELPSPHVVLEPDGTVVDVVRDARTPAHRAIEEAMLAANRAVAEALTGAEVPAVYRIHEPPLEGDLAELETLLEAFGLLGGRGRRRDRVLTPKDVSRALTRVAGRPEAPLVQMLALRSMRQARYAAHPSGHFALAFALYTHFTSPIRRYADLVVHRALKDWVSGDAPARARAAAREGRLEAVAARVSQRERLAETAEREMVALKQCAFMAERLGEEYDGTITGVARHGFYVTLDAFFVEGLVHVSTLSGYAVLDERSYELVIRGTRERWRMGERVRVRVDAVDRTKAWINFSVARRLR